MHTVSDESDDEVIVVKRKLVKTTEESQLPSYNLDNDKGVNVYTVIYLQKDLQKKLLIFLIF